jgi:hypothetical protein
MVKFACIEKQQFVCPALVTLRLEDIKDDDLLALIAGNGVFLQLMLGPRAEGTRVRVEKKRVADRMT